MDLGLRITEERPDFALTLGHLFGARIRRSVTELFRFPIHFKPTIRLGHFLPEIGGSHSCYLGPFRGEGRVQKTRGPDGEAERERGPKGEGW